jgi:diacylglycerol kinase family enzyme
VPPATPMRFVRLATRMMTSRLTGAPDVRHAPAARVVLEARSTVPFQLDGEPVGTLPADVRVMPGAVRLLGVSPR